MIVLAARSGKAASIGSEPALRFEFSAQIGGSWDRHIHFPRPGVIHHRVLDVLPLGTYRAGGFEAAVWPKKSDPIQPRFVQEIADHGIWHEDRLHPTKLRQGQMFLGGLHLPRLA